MMKLAYTPDVRDLTPEEFEWVHGGQGYADPGITETGEGTGTP